MGMMLAQALLVVRSTATTAGKATHKARGTLVVRPSISAKPVMPWTCSSKITAHSSVNKVGSALLKSRTFLDTSLHVIGNGGINCATTPIIAKIGLRL